MLYYRAVTKAINSTFVFKPNGMNEHNLIFHFFQYRTSVVLCYMNTANNDYFIYLKKLISFTPSFDFLDSNKADKYRGDLSFSAQCIINAHVV